jgi:flagellar hook-associated protein 3 FlgL
MRVANKTIYDGVIRNLGRTSVEMFKANELVSTAKKINDLSDDPVGMVAILDLRSSLSGIDQMERNISVGHSWLNSAESALGQVGDLLSTTKELVVQMSTATMDASERKNAVSLVDGYLNQIMALANSQVGGRYIFGGTNTDTTTFTLDGTGTQVIYNGNDTPFSIKIGKESTISIGKDGKDIFGENWNSSNIFKTFIDLKNNLQTNNVEGIQSSLANIDNHMSTLNAHISDIAGKTVRMNIKEQIIADLKLTYTERTSEIEDADIAEAIIELKSKELAYNASLSSASKMMELSLVNFL